MKAAFPKVDYAKQSYCHTSTCKICIKMKAIFLGVGFEKRLTANFPSVEYAIQNDSNISSCFAK